MPTTCEVILENCPSNVCYSGTLMRAQITLTTTSEKTIRGIFAKVKGFAYCRWSTGSGKNRRTHTGEETYLDERAFLLGTSESMTQIIH